MVSIKDVAKHAGVAISTVSKVLNHYPNISEETKTKVNASIKELGFVPNSIAAALSSKQSTRVALLMDVKRQEQTIDEISMQYILGAIKQAGEMGMDIITVFFSMLEGKNLEEVIRYFKVQNIAGIVIYGLSKQDTILHKLVASGAFKIVLIDAPLVNEHTSNVWINHSQAQYDVAKKMMEENKIQKLLYISGKKNGYVSEERMKGMKKLAEEKKLKVLVRNGDFSEWEARKITMKYAKNRDAIVCASDMMAIGAMKALIDMDIFRPVCGFDGITLMGYAGKQMHTVKQDFGAISAQAIVEVRALLEGAKGREIIMPHTLVRITYEDVIRRNKTPVLVGDGNKTIPAQVQSFV